MVALAQLGDREIIPKIEELTRASSNPRILIHAARAFEILQSGNSIPVLLGKLKRKTFPFIRDEIILSIAGIIGIGEFFYPMYNTFLKKTQTGISSLVDQLKGNMKTLKSPEREDLLALLDRLNKPGFSSGARDLLQKADIRLDGTDIAGFLAGALENPSIQKLVRFQFLVAAALIWHCRLTASER